MSKIEVHVSSNYVAHLCACKEADVANIFESFFFVFFFQHASNTVETAGYTVQENLDT